MIKQGLILLAAAALCSALGDGRKYYSKKNTFESPSQYQSVASFHSSKQQFQPQQAPVQQAPVLQQAQQFAAPSPYAFGYEAEGSSRQESADASGKVSGSYKVTNEDGSVRLVKYVADENGFRADIDTNEPGTKSDSPADVTLKSAAVEKKYEAPSKYGAQMYSQKKTSMYEQKPMHFSMGSNVGAYAYNYESKLEDGGSSAQSESADGNGKVTGYYSLSAADGRKRKVDYSADAAGFSAAVNTNEFGTKSDSPAHVQFMSSAPLQGPAANSYAHGSSFQQQQQVRQYSAPAFQQAPIQQASQFSDAKPSPYAFSYDAQLDDGSSSRSESADASGKVTGQYSLAAADGRKRVIKYEADHEGFRAQVDTNEFGTKSDSPANVQFYSSAPQEALVAPQSYSAPAAAPFAVQQSKLSAGSGIKSTFQAPVMSYQGQSSIQYNAPAVEQPSPYAFNYMADLEDGSSSRTESADGSGKVVGSYSLSVADGRQRTVDYLADQGGFRATVNTNEFGTKADSPADVQFYSTATFDEPKRYVSPTAYRPQTQAAASAAGMYSQSAFAQQPIQSPILFNMGDGNGAYSYNYQAALEDGGNSAQSESADGSGKVTGYYSMSIPDGRKRKVDYTADAAGFQASVDTNEFGTKSDSPAHVSFMSSAPQVAPEVPRQATAFKAPSAPQVGAHSASGSVGMYGTSYVNQQKVEPVQLFQPSPYAFNYEAEASGGSSSRRESADANGAVTGSYEVRNADGSVRVVDYIADKNGFRANVKTNELGTKSDNPADVTVKSNAPSAPLAPVRQQPVQTAQFPARTHTAKTSMISQKTVDAWSR